MVWSWHNILDGPMTAEVARLGPDILLETRLDETVPCPMAIRGDKAR